MYLTGKRLEGHNDMSDYPETPVLTDHARDRCQEMGISTKLAKHIWRDRTLTRPMRGFDRVLATAADHPGYVVVVDEHGFAGTGDVPIIITVLFDCDEEYVREGNTYRVIREAS